MKGKKILIIGGGGFLGQSLMESLLKDEITVFYADLNSIKGMEKYFIPLNVLEIGDFMNLDKDFTSIVNLTGQVSNPSNLCFKLNSIGIQNIINFAVVNTINLVQVSTLSVYGSSKNEVTESSTLNPETTYGSCKAMAEYLMISGMYEEQYSIIRLSNLYGEKQSKGMIAYLLRSVKQNDNIFFNNDGSLKRHLLHVSDATNLIAMMAKEFKSGIFNYPGNDVYSIKELIVLLEKILKTTLSVSYQKNKPWENLAKVNSTKIDATYGHVPKYNLINWLTKQLYTK